MRVFVLSSEKAHRSRLADRARRAEQETQAPKRRRGRPLRVTVPRAQAEAQESQAIATFHAWIG